MQRRPERFSLLAGIVLLALGGVLLMHQTGTLELRFDAMAPIAFGAVGAILLASGSSRR